MKYCTTYLLLVLLLIKAMAVNAQPDASDSTNYQIAKAAYNQERYPRAVKYYYLAYQDAAKVNDTIQSSINLNGLGLSYKRLGQYDSALLYYAMAVRLDSLTGNEARLQARYRNLAALNRSKGEWPTAVKYLNQALEISQRLGDEQRIAGVFNSMGNVFNDIKQGAEAVVFFEKSLEIYRRLDDRKRVAMTLNNLAINYTEEKQYDTAIELLRESLAIKDSLGDQGSLAYTIHNMGWTYLAADQLDSAIVYLQRAYDIRKSLGDQASAAITANELAQYYIKINDAEKAAPFLQESVKYALDQDNESVWSNTLKTQAEAEFEQGKYRLAYTHLDQWIEASDSIFEDKVRGVIGLQDQFKESQYEAEKNRLEADQKRAEERNANQLKIIYIVVIALLIVLMAALTLWRQRKRINKLNLMLRTLNEDIRHRKHNDYQRLLNELEKTEFPATDTFRNMLYASVAVDQALYEAGEEMVQTKTYFSEIIDELKDSLNLGNRVKLRVHLESQRMPANKATKTAYILSELLTNSVKHGIVADRPLEVSIETKIQDNEFMALYRDNGSPVDTDKLNKSKGLGWKLMNGFTRQLGGTFNFKREADQNTFTLAYRV